MAFSYPHPDLCMRPLDIGAVGHHNDNLAGGHIVDLAAQIIDQGTDPFVFDTTATAQSNCIHACLRTIDPNPA